MQGLQADGNETLLSAAVARCNFHVKLDEKEEHGTKGEEVSTEDGAE